MHTSALDPRLTLPEGLSREFLLHHRLCPTAFRPEGTLVVAAGDEALLEALDEIRLVYGRSAVDVERVSAEDLDGLVHQLCDRAEQSIELARAPIGDDLDADVRDLANQPPVIRYVNSLVRDAYTAGASDIHFEATREGVRARFRLDGVLNAAPEPPSELRRAVVSRIKLLAELDIAEQRRPQDGRIRVRLEDRDLDVRVSTVPTMFGESVVLRLLDRGGGPSALEDLGMPHGMLEAVKRLVAKPHGLFLVTGPTGSGKTTTLYAALGCRDAGREKIVTVEDPVEYELAGVTQVPVHREAGLAFGSVLRSILRQDPDVIMIGEMRDQETAEIAVQAAMTGHLVFSTLHTNDAASAMPRLVDLGIPSYLIGATVEAVLAQRLVRRICRRCATDYEPAVADLERAMPGAGASRPMRFVRGEGCSACRGTGWRGRTGIFQLLELDRALTRQVVAGTSATDLRDAARRSGFADLAVDGWEKVRSGTTTVEEVLRVAYE